MKISNTINGLWIEGNLSPIELLTIKSFINFGYEFILWTYDDRNRYPQLQNLVVKNAEEIISRDKIFRYKYKSQFGQGKGSFAGFSDVFRYQLLFENGGWWVDMDVTCLSRFDFQSEYVFRKCKSGSSRVVGNIMHVPAKSPLMKYCLEDAALVVNENNTDWDAPIDILNNGIIKYDLGRFVFDFTNDDSWIEVSGLLSGKMVINEKWKAIHWMNEVFRQFNLPKETFILKSEIGKIMQKYQLGDFYKDALSKIYYQWNVSLLKYGIHYFLQEISMKSIKFLLVQTYHWILKKLKSK